MNAPKFAPEIVALIADEIERAATFTREQDFEPPFEAAQRILKALSEDYGVSLPESIPRKKRTRVTAIRSDV